MWFLGLILKAKRSAGHPSGQQWKFKILAICMEWTEKPGSKRYPDCLCRWSYGNERNGCRPISQDTIQRCILHQVRNTLKYVVDKDRKAFAADSKDNLSVCWWEESSVMSPIFKCSAAVRKAIYTTNTIESLNWNYWKLNGQRSIFPSDTALLKALYLATFEATKNGLQQLGTGIWWTEHYVRGWSAGISTKCRNKNTGGNAAWSWHAL